MTQIYCVPARLMLYKNDIKRGVIRQMLISSRDSAGDQHLVLILNKPVFCRLFPG